MTATTERARTAPDGDGAASPSLLARLARLARFAFVGGVGTLVNLAVMSVLLHGVGGVNYVVAAVVAAEVSIASNFVLQERVVFGDVRAEAGSVWVRLAKHVGFNSVEALVRLPLLVLLVEGLSAPPVAAQAGLLAAAFLLRYAFVSRFLYRPRAASGPPTPMLEIRGRRR